jgi:predicted phage terminase large subunit-like protein
MDDSLLEFKRDWFQTFSIQPGTVLANEFPAAPVLISIDPAFRMRQSNDDSGIVVTKTLSDNNVYILEAKGIKANPQMLVEEVFRLVDKYVHVDKVLLETVTSQIMLMDLLQAEMRRRGKFFIIQEVKPDTNETKTARIRGLIPHYSNRRIFHAHGMYALEEQLIEFPRGQHDDIIDALAYQVKFWRPFNISERNQDFPEGSYGYWKKHHIRKPIVLGNLFNDFKKPR